MESLTPQGRVFVAAHEVMHCVTMTISRRGSRSPKLWNIASDHVINLLLKEAGILVNETAVPGGLKHASGDPVIICYDTKFSGLSAEEVYDLLLKAPTSTSTGMSTLDEHIEADIAFDIDEETGTISEREITPVEREDMSRAVRSAAVQAAMAGNVPSGMKRMLGSLNEPTVNWRAYLASEITKLGGSHDYSFVPPDQSFFGNGITIPVLDPDEEITVTVIMDASGSMGPEDLKKVMSEVRGIVTMYPRWRVQVMSFDSVLYDPIVYDSSFSSEIDVISHEVKGGGGTLFGPPLRYVAGIDDYNGKGNPLGGGELVIFFTDGGTGDGWHHNLSHLNVLWLLNNQYCVPPWGRHVVYDRHL
jgi:predicted metal-dependent peptidase